MESIWIFTVKFTGNDTGIQLEIQWIGNSMEYLWIFFENIPKFHKLGSKIHGILMELNGI